MNVILFGATGMVGQGVLRECLLDPAVDVVLAVGRSAIGVQHGKLREVVHRDLLDLTAIDGSLSGFDACFFCLGVTSAGMNEADYTRVTYGITMAAANTLVRLNPGMTFVFVSGAGTDSSEKGPLMWARVKGKAENGVLALPFKGSYAFRIGAVVPMHGVQSRTRAYRILYSATKPLHSLLLRAFPSHVITTEEVGRAMLVVARKGAPKRVLESGDIRALVGAYGGRTSVRAEL